jgi:hypothetical protein
MTIAFGFQDFLGELHTWSKLNHPNILELLGYIEVDNTVGIVSPLILNGHATSYFAKHRTTDPGPSVCYSIGRFPNTDAYFEAL